VRLYVGITDGDWFHHLRRIQDLDEVNFWQPSGSRSFGALAAGEPFLFKLHSPDNFIVGGGFFEHFTLAPVSLAWEAFQGKNGSADLPEMRSRIEKYRRAPSSPSEDYRIGCILLGRPFFLERSEWIEVPPSWAKNIVQGRGYETGDEEGRMLWQKVEICLAARSSFIAEPRVPSDMYGPPVLVRPRLGQGTFRMVVTDIYERRCAISGEKALPVLEAAHIRPVASGGRHELPNGLLLRSDIHTLYDRGYVSVTPDLRVLVSQRLKEDFDNGEPYYPFRGQQIQIPKDRAAQPNREALEWHSQSVFLG
jgi:putative restriction endonuclease